MRIAVMGAGGLGAYLGARLAEAGADVAFVARGAQLAAMRCEGLSIRSALGDLRLPNVAVTDSPADIGPVDLVLFTVKLWDTDAAALAMAPLLGAGTPVVTLQNGIDSVDLITRGVPRHQVLAVATYIAASIASPGVIDHSGGGRRLVVDEATGSPVIAWLGETCRRAVGIDLETTASIGAVVWEKFIRFAAFSAATALMRTTAGPLVGHPEARAFLRQLLEEGVAIAAATGNPVSSDLVQSSMALFGTIPATTRSSMATDLEQGHRLELNWVSGRIHALGLEHGVPTPAHTAAYRGLVIYAEGAGQPVSG